MSDIHFMRDKFTWIQAILAKMQNSVLTFYGRQLEEIVVQHRRATQTDMLVMEGKAYIAPPLFVCTLQFVPKGLTAAPLPPQLHQAFKDWQERYDQFQHGWDRFSQRLSNLLRKAEDRQAFRDMLPDVCYSAFPQGHSLQELTRQRQDLYAAELAGGDSFWSEEQVKAYASIQEELNTYIGYSLLC